VPAADRHPFVTTFLVLFLVDAAFGLVVSVTLLTSRSLFDPDVLLPVTGPFGIALLLGAMVEVTLAFSRNMKWSARWIGLFVLGWQFGSELLVIVLVAAGALPQEGPLLADRALGGFLLGVNLLQVALGAWAVRDLSGGHYRGGGSPRGPRRRDPPSRRV
jgi:hypothetical protein